MDVQVLSTLGHISSSHMHPTLIHCMTTHMHGALCCAVLCRQSQYVLC